MNRHQAVQMMCRNGGRYVCYFTVFWWAGIKPFEMMCRNGGRYVCYFTVFWWAGIKPFKWCVEMVVGMLAISQCFDEQASSRSNDVSKWWSVCLLFHSVLMSRHQAVQIMCRNGGRYVCYFTVFWWAGIKPFKWCVEMVVGMFAISQIFDEQASSRSNDVSKWWLVCLLFHSVLMSWHQAVEMMCRNGGRYVCYFTVFWWAGIQPLKWCVEMVVGMFAISQCFDEQASSRSNDVSKWWLVCLLFHCVLMSWHQAVQMMCRNGGRYVCYFTVFWWAGIKPFKWCVEMVVGMFAISQFFDEQASSRSNDVSKWWLVCLLFHSVLMSWHQAVQMMCRNGGRYVCYFTVFWWAGIKPFKWCVEMVVGVFAISQCFDEQSSSRSNDVSKWWLVCLLFHSVLMSWHQAVQMMFRNGGRYVCYLTVFWWAGIKPFKWCVEMVVGMFAISQCFDELASSRSNDVSKWWSVCLLFHSVLMSRHHAVQMMCRNGGWYVCYFTVFWWAGIKPFKWCVEMVVGMFAISQCFDELASSRSNDVSKWWSVCLLFHSVLMSWHQAVQMMCRNGGWYVCYFTVFWWAGIKPFKWCVEIVVGMFAISQFLMNRHQAVQMMCRNGGRYVCYFTVFWWAGIKPFEMMCRNGGRYVCYFTVFWWAGIKPFKWCVEMVVGMFAISQCFDEQASSRSNDVSKWWSVCLLFHSVLMSRHQAVQMMCRNGGWYVCYFTVFWWAGIKPFKWCVEMVVGMFAISQCFDEQASSRSIDVSKWWSVCLLYHSIWWTGIKPFKWCVEMVVGMFAISQCFDERASSLLKWCVEMVVGMFAISQCFDERASSRSNDVSKWWLVCLLFHSVLMSRHQAVQMMCRNGGRYVCYFTVFWWAGIKPFEMMCRNGGRYVCYFTVFWWAGIKPFKWCVEMVVGMFAISQCFDEQASSRSNDVSKWWSVCLLYHSFWWTGIKPFKWCVEMVVGMFAISQCFDERASSLLKWCVEMVVGMFAISQCFDERASSRSNDVSKWWLVCLLFHSVLMSRHQAVQMMCRNGGRYVCYFTVFWWAGIKPFKWCVEMVVGMFAISQCFDELASSRSNDVSKWWSVCLLFHSVLMSRHQAVQMMCRNGGWYVCYFTVFLWAGIKPFKWCVEMVVGMFAISQCFDELASSRSNDVSKWWLVCLLFHSVLMSRHQAVQMMCRNGGWYVCYFTVFWWAGIKPFKWCVEMVVGMFAISQCFDEQA